MEISNLEALESMFLALSDKTRLKLLALMADGEVSVGYLADTIGESQPKTSRHLAYLRNVGLVSTRRDGKWIYYGLQDRLEPASLAVLNATLKSLGRNAHDASQIRRAEATEAFQTSIDSKDVYDESDMTEWSPNEMAIYLL